MKKFEKAGQVLCEIWNSMTIDGYPVQCTYRDPLIQVADPPTLDPEWVESHCMISKYCLQISKCDDANCCAPPRSDIKEIIGGRFLPGPLLMKRNPQSTSSLGETPIKAKRINTSQYTNDGILTSQT